MNDAQRLEAMDSYFGRYRKMIGRLKASEQEYEDNRRAYEQRRTELQEERTRITREPVSYTHLTLPTNREV